MEQCENEAPCLLREWDTQFFGIRIAEVRTSALNKDGVCQVEQWCANEKIRCLYFLAKSDDPTTITALEGSKFRLVDVRMTYVRKLSASIGLPTGLRWVVREATAYDVGALEAIAATSHEDSRFFFDEKFPVEKSRELYQLWIRKSVMGWADHVLVAESEGKVCGYITGHLRSEKSRGDIGLVGVDKQYSGMKMGSALTGSMLKWMFDQGMSECQVVTQGRNIPANHHYQSGGFRVKQMELWFHRWFDC